MDEREKRLALNESMFREINERLESRIQTSQIGRPELSILCECANPDCTQRIALTTDEYEQARADGRQFVIVPGHEFIEVETVVSKNDRYELVRKRGRAGELAELLDPNS